MIGTVLTLLGFGSKRNLFAIIAVGCVILAVGGTVYAGYRYVSGLYAENMRLTADNATLESSNAQLEQSIEDQQATISPLQADMQLIGRVQQETFNRFEKARDRVQNLEQRLSSHELGFLASQRPGLVENIINDSADDIGRCFEIATGSRLTEQEINATLNSEINSECPKIANPTYRGN
jgi:hypothetical protein